MSHGSIDSARIELEYFGFENAVPVEAITRGRANLPNVAEHIVMVDTDYQQVVADSKTPREGAIIAHLDLQRIYERRIVTFTSSQECYPQCFDPISMSVC